MPTEPRVAPSMPAEPRVAPSMSAGPRVDPSRSVELRVRFPVDDTELSALHHRSFGPDHPGPSAAIRPWANRLERHSLTWVGAFSADRLVGFVHAVWDGGTHAFILDAMVDPDFQRRGIGRDLVRTITDEAFTAGCAWVHVDYQPEHAAFYENACNFRPTPAGLRSAPHPPPQAT
jgi:ribosomal protein S18 acetylase RimI-like enzyme